MYAYANNNSIGRTGFIAKTNDVNQNSFKTINLISRFTISSSLPSTSTVSGNYWNPHWENNWFDTDWPDFFVLSKEGFKFVDWSLSLYKGSLYFDNNENHSAYVSLGNLAIYAGFVFPQNEDTKTRLGFDASASILEVGYDGRIIDVSVSFFTVGATYLYKDGKFEMGAGAGWFGFSISVDVIELIEILS